MNRYSRGRFAIASAAALGAVTILRRPAKAAEFEFKCASILPVDHPVSARIIKMWSAVEQESGGRIRTQYFGSSSLGSDAAMLSQLRAGALDFYWTFPAIVGAVVPAANVGQLGFAFRDEDEALRVMSDSPLGAYVRKEMTAKGIIPLRSMWTNGMYSIIAGSHPIRTPSDLHGFKIRVASGKIVVDLFKALGASPVALAANEIYLALQTKLVDGTAMGLSSMETFRVWEVQKYISLTNHLWAGYWMVANSDAWNRLTPDLQQIIERNHTAQCVATQKESRDAFQAAYAKMQQHGLTLNAVDPNPFIKVLSSYYREWANEFGPTEWGLLQSSLGRQLV